MRAVLGALEAIVMGSVAITARALADAAPDLTLLQWRVLVVLAERDGGLAVGEIAERIGASSSATSRLIGRLVSRGLVLTGKTGADRRVTRVDLTANGHDLVDRVTRRRARDLMSIAEAAPVRDDETLRGVAREFARHG